MQTNQLLKPDATTSLTPAATTESKGESKGESKRESSAQITGPQMQSGAGFEVLDAPVIKSVESTTTTTPAATMTTAQARFSALPAAHQKLLGDDGARVWNELSSDDKGVFYVLTQRLSDLGVDTGSLRLRPDKVRRNRLLLEGSDSALRAFKENVQSGIDEGKFKPSKPFFLFHWGFSSWGARENRDTFTIEIGGGSKGVFIDVDHFHPWRGLAGLLAHAVEIITPGKPGPEEMAREMGVDLPEQSLS
ncbi:hypothetical protein KAI87_09040 [Myxococcota bacterium]|nr:hypothetical protein [Myxococcota bacterium]